MASIGLKVNDSGLGANLGLSSMLAEAIGDPAKQAEMAAKAQAINAQIAAHQAYVTKLNADTGLVTAKTKEEQDAEAERLRAGPLVGAAAAGAVPAIVATEAPRPNSFGGYGPQPGIVDPAAVAQRDALVARERALGPILVRGNPSQVAEGVGKDYGGAILAGATINPAAVKPDVLRLGSTLYTGSAPTTSTVLTSNDTAGQDAEARRQIQVDAAKPPTITNYRDQPGIVRFDAQGNPIYVPAQNTQPTPLKPDKQEIIDLPTGGKATVTRDAQGNVASVTPIPGAGPKQEIVDLPGGGKGGLTRDAQGNVVSAAPIPGAESQPPKQEIQVVNDVPMAVERDPATNKIVRMTPIEGTPAKPPEPLYPGKTPKDVALNRIAGIQQKLASGQPITPQEGATYESDWNQAYGPSNTKSIDPQTGKPLSYSVRPSVPANTPTINDVRKAVGLPPAPEPPADEFAPRVTPEQDKARSFADAAAHAETRLSPMTSKDIPGPVQTWIATQDDPSLLMSLAQSAQDPKTQKWAQTMWEFTNAINRKESGQAITAGEWKTARQLYIPMPGNDEDALKLKHDARVLKIQDVANEGFRSDPNARTAFDQRWKGQGANLDFGGQTAPPVVTPKPPGAPADARQAPDGNWYVPDPARPGKYLQVK